MFVEIMWMIFYIVIIFHDQGVCVVFFTFMQSKLSQSNKQTRKHLYEGKTKLLLDDPVDDVIVLRFKDTIKPSATNDSHKEVPGKGAINNRLNELFMSRLLERGIQNHFISRLSMTEQKVRYCTPLPFKVIVHNYATPDFAYRLNLEEGMILPEPIVEFVHKLSDGQYGLIGEKHIQSFQMASEHEIEQIYMYCQRVNDFLSGQFCALHLQLLNFRLDFGRYANPEFFLDSELMLIDELTPDTMSILDPITNERLDRSLIFSDCSDVSSAYQEVARRFGVLDKMSTVEAALS